MNSIDVIKVCESATEIASSMNSKEIYPAHIVAAILKFEHVQDALEKNKVNTKKLIGDVEKECQNYEKIPATTVDRYKRANIERHLRLSLNVQSIFSNADRVSTDESLWKTGYLEISHLVMSIMGSGLCPSMNEHLNSEGKEQSEVLTKFINLLMKHEADERGMKAPSLAFSLSKGNRKPNGNVSGNEKKKSSDEIEFCSDMLEAAKDDDKPFIGRANELSALMQCLERRDKPNAILAGPPGVGKTDIVRGLAKKIVSGDVPEQLAGAHLYCVDIPGMLAGSEFRGAFEKRLKGMIEEAIKKSRPILFIDEIHMVLGAGKTMDSAMDAANILKPYLTEGKIRVIGATTADEYRKHVEKDAAFMRRFQKIDVSEPSPKDAIEILNGVKPAYESFHNLKINKDVIKSAVELSVKHMHDRFLPDKAIDIIDQTCARVKIEKGKKVTVSDVELTVANICHIPATTVQKDEMEKVRDLGKNLRSQVFGQDEAVNKLTEAVQMAKVGLCDETKPIGSFLFVGPSGVGKTELSKQLAANLGIDFVRFDMSEYAESHTVAKLIGSPAGYVGYDDGGILVEQIRQHPNSVVLFDEIEKAHPDVYKIFLQILDYGMLSDNKGRKADFRNTVIIMTSNAGNAAAEKAKIGFGEKSTSDRKATSMQAVAELMAPELRGRISATIVFEALGNDVAKMIVKKELKTLTARLRSKGVSVKYTDATIAKIVEKGVSAQYGAREIQKVIDNDIKKMFVKQLVSGKISKNCVVDVIGDTFSIITDVKLNDIVSEPVGEPAV